MSGLLGFCEPSISASNRSAIGESFPSAASTFFSPPSALLFAALNPRRAQACDRRRTWIVSRGFDPVTPPQASNTMATEVQEQVEVEVAEGCTLTEFCDKIIDLFLNEKPRVKDWRKYLVFREEWRKYRESFYRRCHSRANSEGDPVMSQKLISLCRKVKKV